uniref:Uncharacterized protein LOC101313650 n=1 Tax=Rhizophora mucronata TaxID=61149 RepID=A0A2P2QXG0_RHIMU
MVEVEVIIGGGEALVGAKPVQPVGSGLAGPDRAQHLGELRLERKTMRDPQNCPNQKPVQTDQTAQTANVVRGIRLLVSPSTLSELCYL